MESDTRPPLGYAQGVVAILSSVLGLIFNGYIILVVSCGSKPRTANNALTFHLAILGFVTSVTILPMQATAAIHGIWLNGEATCQFHGFFWNVLTFLTLWNLCALSWDRYEAILSPLRYSHLANTKLLILFIIISWIIAALISIPPLLNINHYTYSPSHAACLPDYADRNSKLWYPILYFILALLIPTSLMFYCYLQIFRIARSHCHRIAFIINVVNFVAQATVTRRQTPTFLNKFTGKKAICTIFQLLGSLLFIYYPLAVEAIYETISKTHGPAAVCEAVMMCYSFSPLVNGFIYGVQSRELRKNLKGLIRKKILSQYQIRRRPNRTLSMRDMTPNAPPSTPAMNSSSK